jgi:NAD(P)-dependent dehydrogenase (short-subunit alcohol dehydrogenase family)
MSDVRAARRGWFAPLNPRLEDWKGRRAWIVGGSSGIGRATAAALHARGAQVIVSARNAEALAAFVAQHPSARALPLDAGDRAQVAAAAALAAEEGPLDLVVYCAGYYRPLRATPFELDEMVRHQQVNYVGALHLLDALLPQLLRQGHGHVSLVASVAGYRGLPNSLGYGPTKAALINLAQALYLDLRPMGIGVSLVNPGFVATPLTAQNAFAMPALTTPEEAARQMLRGWDRGEFEIHYPKRFTRAMKLLSLLPFGMYQAVIRKVTA